MPHLATVSEISGPSLDQTGDGLHSIQVRLEQALLYRPGSCCHGRRRRERPGDVRRTPDTSANTTSARPAGCARGGSPRRSTTEPSIDVRARLNQRRHGGPDVRELPGPGGGNVEQRARVALRIADTEPGGRARPAHTRYRVAPTTMRSFGAQPGL